jgi:hypothetical protein
VPPHEADTYTHLGTHSNFVRESGVHGGVLNRNHRRVLAVLPANCAITRARSSRAR